MALIPKAAFTNSRIETWYAFTTPRTFEERRKLMEEIRLFSLNLKYGQDFQGFFAGDINEMDFVIMFKTTRPSIKDQLVMNGYSIYMIDEPKRDIEKFTA